MALWATRDDCDECGENIYLSVRNDPPRQDKYAAAGCGERGSFHFDLADEDEEEYSQDKFRQKYGFVPERGTAVELLVTGGKVVYAADDLKEEAPEPTRSPVLEDLLEGLQDGPFLGFDAATVGHLVRAELAGIATLVADVKKIRELCEKNDRFSD